MVQHQVLVGSLGSWARMAGSGSSGIQAAPTPTGWAKKENMTLNWPSLHQLPSPPPRTRTQRTTQVSSTVPPRYKSTQLTHTQSDARGSNNDDLLSLCYRRRADGEEQPPDSYDANQHSQPAEDAVSISWDLRRGVANRRYTDPLWATEDACGKWS